MCAIEKTLFVDFNHTLIYYTHHLIHSASSASDIVKHCQHSSIHNHSFILIQTFKSKNEKKKPLKIGQIVFMYILQCTCIFKNIFLRLWL